MPSGGGALGVELTAGGPLWEFQERLGTRARADAVELRKQMRQSPFNLECWCYFYRGYYLLQIHLASERGVSFFCFYKLDINFYVDSYSYV